VVDPEVVASLVGKRRDAGVLDELTEREREILAMMAEGRSNHGICERLVLSPRTIESHVRTIFQKLDLPPAEDDHRRVLAVLAYLRA
jgi:DNA-binding NarL/FixJ family response regulator